ncbi:hypothetical protein [Amycolatopsis plumensis]|uniref:Uncharacterized protein n=1 Tax=Amycolatopsis plumensis TaxID=236508 RepID=A0ABV5UAE3_9PSEU
MRRAGFGRPAACGRADRGLRPGGLRRADRGLRPGGLRRADRGLRPRDPLPMRKPGPT